jgi:glutamyl/glutaminyl-tRNA synthetase
MESVIDLIKPRAKRLGDFVGQLRPFLVDSVDVDPAAAAKHLAGPGVPDALSALRERFASLPSFDRGSLEACLRALADERAMKAGALIHATRVAVTGQAVSPGIFEVLELVGRDRVLARLTVVRT